MSSPWGARASLGVGKPLKLGEQQQQTAASIRGYMQEQRQEASSSSNDRLQPDSSRLQAEQRQPPGSCSNIRLQSAAAPCSDSSRLHAKQRKLQTAAATQVASAAPGCMRAAPGRKQQQQQQAADSRRHSISFKLHAEATPGCISGNSNKLQTSASTAGCKQAAASCMQR